MQTTQLNVRFTPTLKQEGDEVLRLAGYTPSEAVHILWAFASRIKHEPEKLKETLDMMSEYGEPVSDETQRKLDALARVKANTAQLYESLGIIPAPLKNRPSDKEMLEDALYERYGQGMK